MNMSKLLSTLIAAAFAASTFGAAAQPAAPAKGDAAKATPAKPATAATPAQPDKPKADKAKAKAKAKGSDRPQDDGKTQPREVRDERIRRRPPGNDSGSGVFQSRAIRF